MGRKFSIERPLHSALIEVNRFGAGAARACIDFLG